MKNDKKVWLIAVLLILLFAALGYIGWNRLEQERYNESAGAYQQGYLYGVKETVYMLMQQTDRCNPASVNYGNFTRTVVDVACLRNSTG
jgi:predicted negative regulator of RcsB-dependent stress response